MNKLLLLLLIATTAPACGSSDNNATNSAQNNDPAETTVIRGHLTAGAAGDAGAEGQTVTARRVSADGETGEVEAESTTTSDGAFTLTLDDVVTPNDTIVLDAYTGNEVLGRVLVTGGLVSNNELNSPPITLQSTAETNVRITSRAEGISCDSCTAANLEHRIDGSLAVVLRALSEGEGSVYPAFTEALFAGIDAHSQMLRNDTTTATDSQIDDALRSANEAYVVLQADLAAAASDAEIADAQDQYATSYVQAFLDAGITRQDLAIAAHAEAIARNSSDVTTDPEGQAQLLADVELQRAARVTTAIEGIFTAYGESTDNVEMAANDLMVEIGEAADARADAQSDIDDAWLAYTSVVEGELDAQLNSDQVRLFDAFDESFDIGTDTFLDAVTALDPLAVGGSVAAVAALHAQVVSDSNIDELTESGLDEDSARAYLEVIFHLRAVTSLDAG